MIDFRGLEKLNLADLKRIASGYSSDGKYAINYDESENRISINLQLVVLERLYIKKYEHFNIETLQHYNSLLKTGYSFGAYEGKLLVGFVIAEAHSWNSSLWVHEFHTAATHRKMGIGKRLMKFAAEKAKHAGLRIIVCETQNTNATAIKVYRKLGFRIEGIDFSYYSNTDYPDGEIAVFMKRALQ